MTVLHDIIEMAVIKADDAWQSSTGHTADEYLSRMATAVEEAIVNEAGGPDHIVNVKGFAWTVQHPLTERFEGETLFSCKFTQLASAVADSIRLSEGDGKYRVWIEAGATLWEQL